MVPAGPVDVHQHLRPRELVDALRRRSSPPNLVGWSLHTAGEPPFEIDPRHHDSDVRAAAQQGRAVVSLSTPLGIEALAPDEARPLLDAWHRGAVALPETFAAWAAICETDPDTSELKEQLASGFVGLQVSAIWIATPQLLEAAAPVLQVCADAGAPVLVHPGPVTGDAAPTGWWPALVDYPSQLHAAWWAWHEAGRALLPTLRICFAAGAGLAPVQHERFAARSGRRFVVDHDVFVDTSSYGRQGVDALTRALGIDVVALGSDRPYAEPVDLDLGDAAWHAINVVNPNRLLEGTTS